MNKKYLLMISLVIIILLSIFLGWRLWSALPEEPEINLLTTKLAEIPERYAGSIDGFWWTYEGQTDFYGGFYFASNGETVAYRAMDEEGVWLIVGEKKFGPYERVYFSFSPNGENWAAEVKKSGNTYFLLNGVEIGPYDACVGDFACWIFTANNKFVALVQKGQEYWVLENRKEIGPYDEVYNNGDWGMSQELLFSEDKKYFGLIAERGGQLYFLLNGKEEARQLNNNIAGEEIWQSFISSELGRIIYVVKRDVFEEIDGERQQMPWMHCYLVLGEKEEQGPYGCATVGDFNPVEGFVVSPDKKHVAYKASASTILNGKEIGSWDSWAYSGPLFSPDGKILVYVAKETPKELGWKTGQGGYYNYSFIDGIEIRQFTDYLWDFAFSPDSKYFAFSVSKEGKEYVIWNERELGPYDSVGDLSFSPDSKQLVFWARKDGRSLVVSNGQEGESYDFRQYDPIGDPIFSPDSKQLAYLARKDEKWVVVLNGQKGKTYDYIRDITFSPDGKYLFYGARIDNELWWVVDKTEGLK